MLYNVRFENITPRGGFNAHMCIQKALFFTCPEGISLFDHLYNSLTGCEILCRSEHLRNRLRIEFAQLAQAKNDLIRKVMLSNSKHL